ncbi:TRAP transporter small permease subunit [Gallaecimonas sp. GXIMD4217]|uniref:TRAP transporter small permease subunit n=1 Tax=Gallaecimonas sp. GXIMD4217 TaxID=3131927 RepID=UPI00311B2008
MVAVLNDRLARAASWLALAMVFLTVLVVVMRYAFKTGSIALQESILYLHGAVIAFGVAQTLAQDGHVRVDVLYRHFSTEQRRWVNMLGILLLLLPVSLLLLWLCGAYAWRSWLSLEGSAEAGGLPLVFVQKTLMPLMWLLLSLQGLAELVRLWRRH